MCKSLILSAVLAAVFATLVAQDTTPLARAATALTVPATSSWMDTGIEVQAGGTLAITATGTVSNNSTGLPLYGPNGDPACTGAVLPGGFPGGSLLPCWSLIGRIGNAGTPFFVGTSYNGVVATSGRLWLRMNDDNMGDNSGSWNTSITFTPGCPGGRAPDPSGLTATTGASGQVNLTWPAAGGCTTGYYVYYSTINNIFGVLSGARASDGVINVGNVTSYTLGSAVSLTPSTLYYAWLYSYGPGDSQSVGFASASAISGGGGPGLNIPATSSWVDTGLDVQTGGTLVVAATGLASNNSTGSPTFGPNGDPACTGAVLPGGFPGGAALPCWALIGRIGNAGAPFFVGASFNSVVSSTGRLWLRMNDDNLIDNSGSWNAASLFTPGATPTPTTTPTATSTVTATATAVPTTTATPSTPNPCAGGRAPNPSALFAFTGAVAGINLSWPAAGGCTTGYYVYYSTVNNIFGVVAGARPTDGVVNVGNVTSYVLGSAVSLNPSTLYYVWLYSHGPGDSQSIGFASSSAISGSSGPGLNILATSSWVDTGLDVQRGGTLGITASGLVSNNSTGSPAYGPTGDPTCTGAVLPGGFPGGAALPCWSLIGRVGNTGAPFFVGATYSGAADSSGRLWLRMNDDNLSDNSGSWNATFTFTPGCSGGRAPNPPSIVATTGTAGQVNLTWPAAGGCTTGYYVYYSTFNNIFGVVAGARPTDGVVNVGNVTSYVLGSAVSLNPSTLYYVWLYSYGPGDSQSTGYASASATSGSSTGAVAAEITSPLPGATLSSSTVTFTWKAGSGGGGVSYYYLEVGSTPGGTDILHDSVGNALSHTLTIPSDGRTLYVTLYTFFTDGSFKDKGYQYTAPTSPRTAGTIISPAPGSTFPAQAVTIAWTAGAGGGGVTGYHLEAGSTPGGTDIFGAPTGASLAQPIVAPTDGRFVYVTLYTFFADGSFLDRGYQYRAAGQAPVAAVIASPLADSALSSAQVTFLWSAGSGGGGVSSYFLEVGAPGNSGKYFSNDVGLNLAQAVSGLPVDGTPVVVTVYTIFTSAQMGQSGANYVAETRAGAALLLPSPGTVITGEINWTFMWSQPSGSVQRVQIAVGDRRDAAGNAATVHQSSDPPEPLGEANFTLRCRTGRWSVDLVTTWADGATVRNKYEFVHECASGAPKGADITWPQNGADLFGSAMTIEWTAPTKSYQNFLLRVGTTYDGQDLLQETSLPFGRMSHVVPSGVPSNKPVYVRLTTIFNDGTRSESRAAYNTAGSTTPGRTPARLTSPAQDSVLQGTSATFCWSAGTGAAVFNYYLEIGSPTLSDQYFRGSAGTSTCLPVPNGLPTNGEPVRATLYTFWQGSPDPDQTAASYTAVRRAAAELTAPIGSVSGPTVRFEWIAGAGGVTSYWLEVGTTPGGTDVFGGPLLAIARSHSVDITKVAAGSTLHVTLYTYFDAAAYLDRGYSFVMAAPKTLTFMVPGIVPDPRECASAPRMAAMQAALSDLGGEFREFSYAPSKPCYGWAETNQSIFASADLLDTQITDALRATGASRLTVVAHSLGGAVAVAWAMGHTVPVGVSFAVITIDSPINGCAKSALRNDQIDALAGILGFTWPINFAEGVCAIGDILTIGEAAGDELRSGPIVQSMIQARSNLNSYHVSSTGDFDVSPFSSLAWELIGTGRIARGNFGGHTAVLTDPSVLSFIRAIARKY